MNATIKDRMKFENVLRNLQKTTQKQLNDYLQEVIDYNNDKINKVRETINSGKLSQWVEQNAKENLETLETTKNIRLITDLKNGKEWFDSKLESIVFKLMDFGFFENGIHFRYKSIELNHTRGLDVIIRVIDKTGEKYVELGNVKSRLVWVDCYEKVSHWRFITTFKKA